MIIFKYCYVLIVYIYYKKNLVLKKMNGKTVKYQYYDSNKRSFITVPRAMAEGLNWKHKDDINIVIEVLNGNKGLFLFKKEEKPK